MAAATEGRIFFVSAQPLILTPAKRNRLHHDKQSMRQRYESHCTGCSKHFTGRCRYCADRRRDPLRRPAGRRLRAVPLLGAVLRRLLDHVTARDRVWVSCTIILPLRSQGGSGSPVRPVAIGTPEADEILFDRGVFVLPDTGAARRLLAEIERGEAALGLRRRRRRFFRRAGARPR